MLLAALFAPCDRAAESIRSCQPRSDGRSQPALLAHRRRQASLGNRQSGPRHALGDPLWRAHLDPRQCRFGLAGDAHRRVVRPRRRLFRGPARGADHARRRHPADLSGDPHGFADRAAPLGPISAGRERWAANMLLLVVSIGLSFWVQYARTVRASRLSKRARTMWRPHA